ncbi:MAG: 16S rRNA (cytosine(1402)-N(4))-methyltransferase RsmH [Actinomycetes bacterium]
MSQPVAPEPSGPSGRHVPVLLETSLELLAPALDAHGAVLLDATVGLGGHSAGALERHPGLRLVGLDRDPEALALAGARLERFGDRVHLVRAVYDQLSEVLAELGIARVSGVLFDLGVSSLQLDTVERGFSYAVDAPLDMRMDPSRGRSAAQVLNEYPVAELARVIARYGEERFAWRIAETIVRERSREPFTRTARLAELVRTAIPAATRRHGGHPAKRTFQALRIEVNGELDALGRALPASLDALGVGGRIVVLAYHSLEDRLVKQTFAAEARPAVPPGMPVVPPGAEPRLRLLTRGALTASDEEATANPRAASVRLRAAERTSVPSTGWAA